LGTIAAVAASHTQLAELAVWSGLLTTLRGKDTNS
jgi:hypothetical protein